MPRQQCPGEVREAGVPRGAAPMLPRKGIPASDVVNYVLGEELRKRCPPPLSTHEGAERPFPRMAGPETNTTHAPPLRQPSYSLDKAHRQANYISSSLLV